MTKNCPLLRFSNATDWKSSVCFIILKNSAGKVKLLSEYKVYFIFTEKERCYSKITNSSICLCHRLFIKLRDFSQTFFMLEYMGFKLHMFCVDSKPENKTDKRSSHKRVFPLGTFVHYGEFRD